MTMNNLTMKFCRLALAVTCAAFFVGSDLSVQAEENLPWLENPNQRPQVYEEVPQDIRPYERSNPLPRDGYSDGPANRNSEYYEPRNRPAPSTYQRNDPYVQSPRPLPEDSYGRQRYPERPYEDRRYDDRGYDDRRAYGRPYEPRYPDDRGHDYPPPDHNKSYSENEIVDAGHRFFGTVSSGLAKVIAYAFRKSGRPNGYILGEEAGGAFIAGLRYGEGHLHTKHLGNRKIYWQGPSVGYDFGAEGSKTMILVYNLHRHRDIFHRFGGIDGSAYLVGGVGITFQKYGDIVLAPIRSGVGLRFGANVGYLKYSARPTWNPF